MLEALANRWPALAARGAVAILFGILAIIWPGSTLLTLVLLFGIFALADGIVSGVLALGRQPTQPRWLLGIEAALGIILGLTALARPGLTLAAAMTVVGIWALVVGALRIGQAVALRKQISNEWLLAASGALTIVLGVLVLAQPAAAALAVAWLIGILAIAFGAMEIGLALRLRDMARNRAPQMRLWSMRAEEKAAEVRDKIER